MGSCEGLPEPLGGIAGYNAIKEQKKNLGWSHNDNIDNFLKWSQGFLINVLCAGFKLLLYFNSIRDCTGPHLTSQALVFQVVRHANGHFLSVVQEVTSHRKCLLVLFLYIFPARFRAPPEASSLDCMTRIIDKMTRLQ